MKFLPIALAGYLLLALELALRPMLALGSTGIAPHFVIILVAFIAMNGQGLFIYGVALVMGLLIDVTAARAAPGAGATFAMFGPHAIGYVAAAYLVVTMRGFLLRRSPLAIPFLSVVAAAMAVIVSSALLMVRSWFDSDWTAPLGARLGAGMASALYTALPALVLSPLLRRVQSVMGLDDGGARRFGR